VLRADDDLIDRIKYADAGHGYDTFGFHPRTAKWGLKALAPLYNHYFRVTSYGAEHIPPEGGVVLAANHAGMLPFDGIMLALDVMANTDPPRMVRTAMDLFVPLMPFVGTFFQRCGAVAGSRGNFGRLLEGGEILASFPEGVPGIAKPIWKRYQLQKWTVGHCELAIRHGAPVVPVGIIGSEEMWPQVGHINAIKLFGAPYLPLPLTPLPLPVRFHIHYGEPLPLHEEHPPSDADRPEVVAAAAARVRDAVDALVRQGLRERKAVFS
jgi:1-acyl-sn-glycerol-3-phosphate acyltransferase